MDRRTSTEEDRDALIANLTEMALRSWTARLLAGEARAISDLQNVVLDRLSDDEAKTIFVQAATGQGADGFNALAVKAMYDSCEVEAIKQVERMEQIRADEARMARIERRVWDRQYGVLV